ncbi:MAG: putative toxin-antitoxin system toxin component, PIN family [Boseongicola sp.]|nr:putative toxin-antitoxin system toxin component, PIN family [Boseongicola sp.]
MQRVVIDANVFVSAIMASAGAPRQVLRLALSGEFAPIFGNALFCEQEGVLARDASWKGCPVERGEREALLDALLSVSLWMPVHFLWRPNLADEGDNHVPELAAAGGAESIVTSNKRACRRNSLHFPSIRIKSVGEFLERRRP